MEELTKLFNQIEQLSLENRAKLVDYIAFLQWQEQQQQALHIKSWSFSFIEAFKEASTQASDNADGMDIKMAPATVGGDRRPALWAHPPVAGQAIIEYYVPVPQQVSDVQLHLAVGIRDGAQITEQNLVAFGVRVNGVRVWGQQTNDIAWKIASIPLNVSAGDMVRFEFTTEALDRHEWTWAVWGNPELTGKIE